MNRVRLGEGPATLVKRQYINQELAKIGIRLVLSLSSVTGWGVAVTVTLSEAGRNLNDRKALKKMVKRFALNIPEEGLWAGGYAGTRAAISAIIRARTQQAMQEAVEKMLVEARNSAAARGEKNFDAEKYLQSLLAQTESNSEEPVTADESNQEREDGERTVLQALAPKEITTIRKIVAVEESVEGTLQPANDAQQKEATDEPAISTDQKSAQRSGALNRPGVKSFAGSKTAAVSLISRSAEASTTEPEEGAPRSRGKRAAETEELPPSRYYYPAPARETAVDAELVRRVLQTFPYKNGFRIPAKDATLSAERQKVYHHDGNVFLYIGGRYRFIKLISQSEDGAWEAEVYPYPQPVSAENQPLKIKFDVNDDTWHLADESDSSVTIDPDVVTTMYITWLTPEETKEAEKIPKQNAYTYAQMLPGSEGQLYDDGESKYIFLGGRYWPIQFTSNDTFTIPAENTPTAAYKYQINKLTPAPKPVSPIKPATVKETDINAESEEKNTEPATAGAAFRPHYPAPNRVSSIDPKLEQRVSERFPIINAYRLPVSETPIFSERYKYYTYHGGNFLYIGGRYRVLNYIKENEDGSLEAELYPHWKKESEDNPALKVRFDPKDEKWHLSEDVTAGEETISAGAVSTVTVTQSSPELTEAAKKWPTSKAYTYPDMLPGQEGQVYDDSEKRYIYLNQHYWNITLTSSTTAIIKAINNGKDVAIQLNNHIWQLDQSRNPIASRAVEPRKMPAQSGDATADKDDIPAPGLSSQLKTHSQNWQVADPLQKNYPVVGIEGAIYKNTDDNLSIYINGKYWPFIFIGKKAGAVFVTENNQQKAIIIHHDTDVWQYAGENIAKDFSLFISIIEKNDFDRDIQDEITSLLAASDISWGDTLRKLNDAINKQFNRLYTQPVDKKLEDIIWLRFVLSGYLDSLSISQNESESETLTWNTSLLALYQSAFAKDIDDHTKLVIAQQVLYLKGNIENNIKALDTTSLEKSIAEVNKEIADKAAAIHFHKVAIGNAQAEEVKINLTRGLENLEKVHKEFIKKRDALRSVLDNIKNKKKGYQKDIENYTAQYGTYWAGIALGKEVFNRHLTQLNGKANLSQVAVKSLIELALQEVAITSKVRAVYTENELRELEKIRVARAEVKQLLVRQQFFQSLLPLVESSEIQLPDAKGNYEDIIWANAQGEKLSQTVTSADHAPERNIFLSAIFYWLMKHGKRAADLKDKNIDDIIDEYNRDVQKLNPLTQEKTVPEGYVPLSGMMGSEFFELQAKFNEQFSNYKDKYIDYDASERTKEILLISGIAAEDVLQSVKKKVRLKISFANSIDKPENGELLFLQLPDSRWVFFSLFPGAVTTKIFTHNEMMANDYLKAIATMEIKDDGDGISEVYDSAFFANKYDFNPKKSNAYKDSNVRWNDINTGLMYGVLYKEELINGEPVPDFLKDGMAYSVSFNTRDNRATSDTVVSAVNSSMRSVLNRSADALKSDLYTPSVLQQIAFTLVPFYKEIYHASTDKDYQPDVGSIILDVVSVVSVAAQSGMKVATIIKNTATLGKIMQQGARSGLTGKALRVYAVRELAKESAFSALKLLKVGALATIDLVDPVSARGLGQMAINRVSNASNFRKIFFSASSNTERTLLTRHARSTVAIENMQAHTLHGATVYSAAGSAGSGPFFIKLEKDVYEVRWDEAFQTWRIVDPENPDVLSYGVSVKQENNIWVVSDADNARPATIKDILPDTTSDRQNVGDALENKTMMSGGLAPENPVRAAARHSRYAQGSVTESGEYAAQLLEDAKLISSESATALKEGLKQALANPSKEIGELFSSQKLIDSEEKLLRVKQGEILLFSEIGADGKATQHIHVMVSLGNGRFAGVKNSALGPTLNDSKSILTAEQLGEFSNNVFKRRGDDSLPALQIIAGEPKNFLRPESPSLKSLAENLHGLPDDVDLAAKSTEMLKQAGELATEQAAALQESLGALLNAAKGGSTITTTAESLFTTAVQVTDRAALQAMEKGKLVVFANPSSPSFAIHHLMYSLGNGDFMMVNPHLLDKRLVSQNGIINASQFPDELFTKYGVLSGDISLSRLRTASLLGRDASFFVNGPILTVRLHGAPGIANFMDAYELSEVIKGLGLRESPPVKLGQIREIKLESCFGAFGFLPTGKALAHILGKKVTAYPLAFSNALRDSRNLFRRAKVYMPSDFPSADLISQMEKQQARNHDFWNRLLGMYREVREKSPITRIRTAFDDLLNNVAEVAAGKTDVATFLSKTPEYKSGLEGDVKDLEALCKGEVSDAQAFAERCIDIISMSNNAVKQLNSHLGGE